MASNTPARSGFGLQQVLRGFDQQHIDATFDERGACSSKAKAMVVELMCPRDGSLVVGPIEPATKRGLSFRGELPARLPSRSLPRHVDLAYFVLKIVFGKHYSRSANVSVSTTSQPTEKNSAVNVLNNVGTAQHQEFVATFLAQKSSTLGLRTWSWCPSRRRKRRHGL